MMRFACLLILLAISCADGSNTKRPVELGQEFDLRIGETASITAERYYVGFSSVTEDSRCPEGVDCIWAGNAVVRASISKVNGRQESVDLNTGLEPKEKLNGGYRLRLVRLRPYPKKDETIGKKDYVATFVVSKEN